MLGLRVHHGGRVVDTDMAFTIINRLEIIITVTVDLAGIIGEAGGRF